jgi:hypothetical protein
MSRNLLGEIPDDYHENDALQERDIPPLSAECLEWIERLKVQVARLLDHGSDKYRPGDVVGGY